MIKIRRAKKGDEKQIARVVRNTFSKFNSKEGTKPAIQNYISGYSPSQSKENLIKKFSKTPIIFVAEENKKVIGVLRGSKERITNLYILGKWHGRNIGKKLMEKFEREAEKQGSKVIKIRSSLYALPFYEKFGYKKSTGIQKLKKGRLKGIRFYPLIKRFQKKK